MKPGAALLLAALALLPQIERPQPVMRMVGHAPPSAGPVVVPGPARRAPPAIAPPNPGARIERLLGSADPNDALRAYRLLERCHLAGAGAAACRGVTAVQLRLRLALLETAVQAGVAGAATAWAGQGPFGDKSALTQRPDDPLVVQWMRDAEALIRDAARRDDVAAIAQLGWLAVHWDMAEAERFHALVASAHEWRAVAQERE